MPFLRNITSGLRSLFRKEQVDRELDEELRAYQDMATEEKTKQGMNPNAALRAVRLERGSVEIAKEIVRSGGWEFFVETCWQDLRFASRTLRKSPGFTVVAVLTLALGIGANTAIFSLLNAVLLRNLPVKNPNELVLLGTGRGQGSTSGVDDVLYSYRFYEEVAQRNQVFSETSAMMSVPFDGMHGRVAGSASLEPMNVQLVSGTYFSMLGVEPVLGREFTKLDDEPLGAHAIAMISYSWWTRRFARDPAVIGTRTGPKSLIAAFRCLTFL
jgi:MacB-like periplasmic core domain